MGEHGALVTGRGLARNGADEGEPGGGGVAGARDAAGLPEVGIDGAVAGIEEAGQLAEVLVLLAVLLAVDGGGGAPELGVLKRGSDVGGREHARGEGEVHAGGEERIDEAGGIAGKDEPLAGELAGGVGPVANDGGAGG